MQAAFPVSVVRTAEQAAMDQLPDGVLMQRAATGLATHCLRLLGTTYGRRVLLLVGAGNNGGDTLYAGARLARSGAAVTAALLDPDKAHPGGLADFRAAGGRTAAPDAPDLTEGVDLVLDGLLGIGGKGGLRPEAAALAERVQGIDALVVAVDLPSGVDADTGEVAGAAVSADVTVTFGELKPGLLVGAGAEHCGEVRLVDIGLGPYLPDPTLRVLERADAAAALKVPGPADDKYTRGVIGVIAGSSEYSGAAVLAVGAALHGGAGMVRYVGSAGDAIRAAWPEVVVHDSFADAGRVQAWAIGPGLSTTDEAGELLDQVLATGVSILVDADALTLLAKRKDALTARKHPTVLTPHDREFARIFGDVGPDRLAAARRAADESGAVVLLKGNATIVAGPDGSTYVNRTGTPWLGTAGSGDVLSGLTGSILATGVGPALAAAVAAHVHGVAGQIAATTGPPSAGDVMRSLRPALHAISAGV